MPMMMIIKIQIYGTRGSKINNSSEGDREREQIGLSAFILTNHYKWILKKSKTINTKRSQKN